MDDKKTAKIQRWMNPRAKPGFAYVPTSIEHVANVITHGIWMLPACFATFQLCQRSKDYTQLLAANIYGLALISLFTVSTCFHLTHYINRHRTLKDLLHRGDRAMIYIFIAGSYFPWLSLTMPAHPTITFTLKWLIWILASLGIIYQQLYHERYKSFETFLYIFMGIGPSLLIIVFGSGFHGISELKLGGLLYIIGICFFKSDGLIPFAHAIWHLFVVIAASVHYYAILYYLYP